MSCRNFETIITELARGQMMEARVKEEALAHMKACERCAKRFADEQTLTAGLRAVAASTASTAPPMRVETALLSAFRQGTNAPFTTQTAPKTIATPWLPWSIAAAAAILIFSAFALPRLLPGNSRGQVAKGTGEVQPAIPLPQAITGEESTESNPENQPMIVEGNSEEPSGGVSAVLRPTDRRRAQMQTAGMRDRTPRRADKLASATNANEEIVTEFLPITYGSNLSQLDDGQVVRVELPRSALQSFGLPVNAERAGERVKADVLLGYDGVARAIRFVR